MRTIKLSTSENERLNYERFYYPCPIVQKRIHAVYLKATLNQSDTAIGQMADLHRNLVSKYRQVYESGGFEALCKVDYGTNNSELSLHATSLKESFKAAPPASVAQAMSRIEDLTGIKRGYTQVRCFMKRLGLGYRKMGHIPAKADTAKQKQCVVETLEPVIERVINKECHLFFLDAAHFVLGAFICSVWCFARMFIKSAAGRNRINVLGAVHAVTKEITTLINTDYINANTIVEFLKQLKDKYCDLPIYIVLDNARYQHCELVIKTALSLDITLLFLPPYSPNLNIIERLWKLTKKKILYGKYYDSPTKFHNAIINFFQTINQSCQDDLKTLLTLKFQFFDKENALIYAA